MKDEFGCRTGKHEGQKNLSLESSTSDGRTDRMDVRTDGKTEGKAWVKIFIVAMASVWVHFDIKY